MLRGAFILAVGYIAGYSHAAARNDEIAKTVQEIKKAWAEASEPPTNSDDEVVEGEIAES